MSDAAENTYLTDRQIASDPEFRNVTSASTLQKLRVRGDGPQYVKVGGKCLYTRKWMRAWIEAKVVRSTSDAA